MSNVVHYLPLQRHRRWFDARMIAEEIYRAPKKSRTRVWKSYVAQARALLFLWPEDEQDIALCVLRMDVQNHYDVLSEGGGPTTDKAAHERAPRDGAA